MTSLAPQLDSTVSFFGIRPSRLANSGKLLPWMVSLTMPLPMAMPTRRMGS